MNAENCRRTVDGTRHSAQICLFNCGLRFVFVVPTRLSGVGRPLLITPLQSRVDEKKNIRGTCAGAVPQLYCTQSTGSPTVPSFTESSVVSRYLCKSGFSEKVVLQGNLVLDRLYSAGCLEPAKVPLFFQKIQNFTLSRKVKIRRFW
jgi:hypothetical protein